MAELNELLQQAVGVARASTQEAARAGKRWSACSARPPPWRRPWTPGPPRRACGWRQLSVRLNEAEAELAQEGAQARSSLQVVEASARRAARARAGVPERGAGGPGRAARRRATSCAPRSTSAESRRPKASPRRARGCAGWEAAAEARLAHARQEIAAFRGLIDDGRAAASASAATRCSCRCTSWRGRAGPPRLRAADLRHDGPAGAGAGRGRADDAQRACPSKSRPA